MNKFSRAPPLLSVKRFNCYTFDSKVQSLVRLGEGERSARKKECNLRGWYMLRSRTYRANLLLLP